MKTVIIILVFGTFCVIYGTLIDSLIRKKYGEVPPNWKFLMVASPFLGFCLYDRHLKKTK